MIDHISIAVRDIKAAEAFYIAFLAPLGSTNCASGRMLPSDTARNILSSGSIAGPQWCRWRPTVACIFACGPLRPKRSMPFTPPRLPAAVRPTARRAFAREYHDRYYAAFIRDPDGNRLEAVTFIDGKVARSPGDELRPRVSEDPDF